MIYVELFAQKEILVNPPQEFTDFKKIICEKFDFKYHELESLKFITSSREIKTQEDYLFEKNKGGNTIIITLSIVNDNKNKEEKKKKEKIVNKNRDNVILSYINKNGFTFPNNKTEVLIPYNKNNALKQVHENIACDGCGCDPLIGNRYKCTVCDNFDFCEECINNIEHDHPFIEIKDSKFNPTPPLTRDEIPGYPSHLPNYPGSFC